jgi:hypothetical protein
MERVQLAAVLAAGKTFDATSTLVVLSLRSDVAESTPFVRHLFETFGLAVGSAISVVVAVVALAVLAESGLVVARVVRDAWVPEWYPTAIRVGTYAVGTVWFTLLGVHNFSLLV